MNLTPEPISIVCPPSTEDYDSPLSAPSHYYFYFDWWHIMAGSQEKSVSRSAWCGGRDDQSMKLNSAKPRLSVQNDQTKLSFQRPLLQSSDKKEAGNVLFQLEQRHFR